MCTVLVYHHPKIIEVTPSISKHSNMLSTLIVRPIFYTTNHPSNIEVTPFILEPPMMVPTFIAIPSSTKETPSILETFVMILTTIVGPLFGNSGPPILQVPLTCPILGQAKNPIMDTLTLTSPTLGISV